MVSDDYAEISTFRQMLIITIWKTIKATVKNIVVWHKEY